MSYILGMKECCPKEMHDTEVKALLKQSGLSCTSVKVQMLKLLIKSRRPLSQQDLMQSLASVNDSTVFRGLKQLTQASILAEVDLGEGFKRYEVKPENHHHHHIQCTKCGDIETLATCDLSHFTKALKKIGYTSIQHKLEFFGLCKSCS